MINSKATFPLYVVDDLEAQKGFYGTHLGFEAVFFEPDFYLHLVNTATGAQIGFMKPALDHQPDFLRGVAAPEGHVISFEVANAREALRYAESSSLEIVLPYTEEAFSQKHFMVRDPAGLILDIVEDDH